MSNVYITSDHHFGHKNIIKYANRPYSTVEEMDEDLIRRWNEVVRPEDTVWHLGDFCFGSLSYQSDVFDRLNGHKNLILGNHDGSASRMQRVGFDIVSRSNIIGFRDKHVFMIHKPEDADCGQPWSEDHIILFGHIHNSESCYNNNVGWVNCCVENWDYRPVLLETLIEKGMNNG